MFIELSDPSSPEVVALSARGCRECVRHATRLGYKAGRVSRSCVNARGKVQQDEADNLFVSVGCVRAGGAVAGPGPAAAARRAPSTPIGRALEKGGTSNASDVSARDAAAAGRDAADAAAAAGRAPPAGGAGRRLHAHQERIAGRGPS